MPAPDDQPTGPEIAATAPSRAPRRQPPGPPSTLPDPLSPPPLRGRTPGQLPARLPAEVSSPTGPDEALDRYARLVRAALGVPVALVSLVSTEGQVFPGAVGLPQPFQQARCTGLSHSFCQHVVAHDAPLVVTDAREDPLLADNRAVEDIGVIAYAGFPLHGADGAAVGSLCAIDTRPRQWSAHELDVLADLAATAAAELALRRSALEVTSSRGAEAAAVEHVTQISESMAVGYLVLDARWRISYVNTEARRVLGAAADDLTGRVLWDAFPATVGTVFEESCRRAVDTGQVVVFDTHHPAPLDAWFEIRATPQGGGLALYLLDITARHLAQDAASTSAGRLAALGGIALALTDAEQVSELVGVIAEQGLDALGADGGAVAVPDPEHPDRLWSYITASYGPGVQADYAHLPLDAPLPVCRAFTSGQRQLLGDAAASRASSPAMGEVVDATGCQAWASLPLRAGGQVIGVLTAGWREPQRFEQEQRDLLETFASQCAQALQRLQAREAERRAADAARLSAQRQGGLVTIARALAAADTQDDVLVVLDTHGNALLEANGCGLCLREDDGAHVTTLVTDGYAEVRTTVQRVPADFPLPAIRSAATGTTHFLGDRAETEAAFPGSEQVYAGAGVQASAAVPLHGRDHLLGCLSVGFAEPRTWTDEERELLEAFAALTAQALDRIAAQEAEHAAMTAVAGISETLQRSMLTAPPEPDHLQIAVRYAAAADHAEVGGDWYDAFITSDGLTSLVIGDVTGHDMRAAAVMGQMRNLLRGIGYTLGVSPAEVLAALDRASAGLGLETVATAVVAQVEQSPAHRAAGTRLLRWSNAGHPPPLLISADGTVRYLDGAPDLVLGWDPAVHRHDHEVVLQPGATLLLYTDGLVERRRESLQTGLDWLAETAGRLSAGTLDELCDGLLALVAGHLDDDVALLAVRAHPEDAPRPPEAGPVRVPAELGRAREAAGAE